MATPVKLEHPQLRIRKVGYRGFSWTMFFFGFWSPLFRGDFLLALGVFAAVALGTSFISQSAFLGMLVGFNLGQIGGYFGFFFFLGFGLLVWLLWSFNYNNVHLMRLLKQGYVILDDDSGFVTTPVGHAHLSTGGGKVDDRVWPSTGPTSVNGVKLRREPHL